MYFDINMLLENVLKIVFVHILLYLLSTETLSFGATAPKFGRTQ